MPHRVQKKGFISIIEKHNNYKDIEVIVETGTHRGVQTKIMADTFKTVHAIELSKFYCEETKKACKNFNNVTVHNGSSVDLLPKVIREINSSPALFYLDAHYCSLNPPIPVSEFPLWKELEIIKRKKGKNIIMIDDVQNFGILRDDLKLKNDVISKNILQTSIEWAGVTTRAVLDFMGDIVFDSEINEGSFILWINN
jgi:hypothetical protein